MWQCEYKSTSQWVSDKASYREASRKSVVIKNTWSHGLTKELCLHIFVMNQVQEDSNSFCVECYVCKVRVYCSKYFDKLKFAVVDKLFRGFFPNFVRRFIFCYTRYKPSYISAEIVLGWKELEPGKFTLWKSSRLFSVYFCHERI